MRNAATGEDAQRGAPWLDRPSQGRGNADEPRDPRRGGRKEARRRTPSPAGLALRGFPRECPTAPAHGLTFKEVVVLVVAGAHGAAEGRERRRQRRRDQGASLQGGTRAWSFGCRPR